MKNIWKNLMLSAVVMAPFALTGCTPECVDATDCADKAAAQKTEFTCVSGVCKAGSPFPDAGSTGGGGGATGGGTGGGTTGGGTGGGTTGGGTGGGTTGGGTGGGTTGGGTGGGTTGGGTGGSTGGGTGGGDDAGTDAGADVDAGSDAGSVVDAGTDAGADVDAGTDAGMVDAGMDAGVDAGLFFAVLRVGPAFDGGALSNAAAEVHFERRDLVTGAVSDQVTLPFAVNGGNYAFTLGGSSATEGTLNLSTNNQYLVAGGYNSAPGVATVKTVAGVQRVVARFDLSNGTLNTGTIITDAYVGDSIRSAASVDGTAYWLGGTAGSGNFDAGVRYVVHNSTGATADVYSGLQNIRAVEIIGNQLYASTGSTPPAGLTSRVFSIGTGTPISTATAVGLPGVPLTAPGNYALLDMSTVINGYDTLYVAETGGSFVGARKYTYDSVTWTEAAFFPVPSGTGIFVAAKPSSATSATVLVTAVAGVLKWEDTGLTGNADAGVLVTATPAGSAFRGIVFLP